jgi:hypothetical protein
MAAEEMALKTPRVDEPNLPERVRRGDRQKQKQWIPAPAHDKVAATTH